MPTKEVLTQKIETALDSIRGYLETDGGGVRLHNIREEDMVVEVELLGNCEGCNMSIMTLKAGIEEVIKKAVPDVAKVVAIN